MSLLAEANLELANVLKDTLSKFLLPDNNIIEQATKSLTEVHNHPSFISTLFYILCNEESIEVRQMAAVVLRRKLSRCWKPLADNVKVIVRQTILEQLTKEPNDGVSRSVMQLIGLIAKYELAKEHSWPELMTFIASTVKMDDSRVVQKAVQLLSIVCDCAAEHFSQHYSSLLSLLHETLSANTSPEVAFYTIQAFNALIPYLGTDQLKSVREMIPKSVEVVKLMLTVDESRAAEILETFETLIETEVSFIAPFVRDLVLFSLEIAKNEEFELETRVRALSLLQCIISTKKRAVIKLSLLGPICSTLWPIITSMDDDEEESGFVGDDTDVQTPCASALQVIDELALHLPPEKIFAELMPFIAASSESQVVSHQRGLLLTLACLSEGTSEYIKSKHIDAFLQLACKGASHTNPLIRNAAMFAIGQFSEFLFPDMNKYATDVMPILFQALQQASTINRSAITKAYYALETYVENLENELTPYLNELMTYLINALKSTDEVYLKELIISALAATASAAGEKISPYLTEILDLLRDNLKTLNTENEKDLNNVHTQALDALGVLVRTLGKTHMQLSEDCLKLGMNLIETEITDPDIKRTAFGLFSAVASIVEEKMEPFLEKIIKSMLASVESTEGLIAHFTDEEGAAGNLPNFAFLDDSQNNSQNSVIDIENENDEEDDDDIEDVEGFSVENAYMEEKSDACECLGDLAKYTKTAFKPYLGLCFDEVMKQVDFPHSDVKKAAIATCGQFVCTAFQLTDPAFSTFLTQLYPMLITTLVEETERIVVMTTTQTIKEMIEVCGTSVFANNEHDLRMLMESVITLLNQKSACQDQEDDDEDEQQAEYDEMLIEYVGEIFPALAEQLRLNFLPYFKVCLPLIVSKLKSSCTTAERSFGAGTIAETVEKMGGNCSSEILSTVLPRFMQLAKDEDTEVRNNSIYGLGVLMQNGDEAAFQHFPMVLGCLSAALTNESSRRVVDNILGAVARLINTQPDLVPLKQVVPVLLSRLPIEEDHDEDAVVYSSLLNVFRREDTLADEKLGGDIFQVLVKVLRDEKVGQDIRSVIGNELRTLWSQNSKRMAEIGINLNADDLILLNQS